MTNLSGIQPDTILVTNVGAPVRVVAVTHDGIRADCELACGVIENIGAGNLRMAQKYEHDSWFRMHK